MPQSRELQLANQLQAIRDSVDAFNPDARLAVRSAFEAAEEVWKLVPEIIATLRAVPPNNPRKVVTIESELSFADRAALAAKEFSDLIGLTVPQAEKRALNRGIETVRVTAIDGEEQIGTCDYLGSRLNVSTERGRIVAISGVG